MKKIIFSVILTLIFLTIFISCVNEKRLSQSNAHEENVINDSDDNTENDLGNNTEIGSDNNTKKDIGSNADINSNNDSTDTSTKDMFLSNIPYDKNIKYTSSINGNLANGSCVVDDENFIYYINVKDENKLYKIDKNGNNKQLVYEEKIENLQYFNGKLYFLISKEIEKDPSGFPIYDKYICSVDNDGNNFVQIIKDREIIKFLVLNDKIYYIAYSGTGENLGLSLSSGKYDLFCYNTIYKEKSTIYETILITDVRHFNSPLLINENKIYFKAWTGEVIEYNTEKNISNIILENESDYYTHTSDFIVCNNMIIFACSDGSKYPDAKIEIYLKDLKRPEDKPLLVFTQIEITDMIMSFNVNDNYIFLTYTPFDEIVSEKSKINFIRMKHDGSEIVKIKEIYCSEIGNLTIGEVYLINDKLIFLHKWGDVLGKIIKIIDFDGNDINWDI
jgi:hypothetical protein